MKKLVLLFLALFAIAVAQAQTETELTFTSTGLSFPGTLTLPDGNGPFPIAVFIHGSGPNDRDQTVVLKDANSKCLYPCLYGDTIKTLRDLAHGLAKQGIASFRYDKRTFLHAQSLDPKTISPYDMITDLHNAVDFIKQRPEVDASQIYLLGHSKGVNNIAIEAGRRNDIKALVALAGTARPIDSVISEQVRYIYQTCADSATGDMAYMQMMTAFMQMRDGSWPSNQPFMGAYPKFWLEWMGITDSAIIHFNMIEHPVLFLQGDADFNVRIENALRFQSQVVRPNVKTVIFDSVNHFLTYPCTSEVPQVLLDTIVNFLKDVKANTAIADKAAATTRLNISYEKGGVRVSSKQPLDSLQLFDLNGRIIMSYVPKKTSLLIENESLQQGMYIIRAYHGKNASAEKVLIK